MKAPPNLDWEKAEYCSTATFEGVFVPALKNVGNVRLGGRRGALALAPPAQPQPSRSGASGSTSR